MTEQLPNPYIAAINKAFGQVRQEIESLHDPDLMQQLNDYYTLWQQQQNHAEESVIIHFAENHLLPTLLNLLHQAKQKKQHVSSTNYSLRPSRAKNLEQLEACQRELLAVPSHDSKTRQKLISQIEGLQQDLQLNPDLDGYLR